jgi:hypothetical protein
MTRHVDPKIVGKVVAESGMDAAIERWGSALSVSTLRRLARAGIHGAERVAPHRCKNSADREREILDLVMQHGVTDAAMIAREPYAYVNALVYDRGLTDYPRKQGKRGATIKFDEEDLELIVNIAGDFGITRAAAMLGEDVYRVRRACQIGGLVTMPRSEQIRVPKVARSAS